MRLANSIALASSGGQFTPGSAQTNWWHWRDATQSGGNLTGLPWRVSFDGLSSIAASGNAPAVSSGIVFDSSNSEAMASGSQLSACIANNDAYIIIACRPTTAINGTGVNTYQNGAPFLDQAGYFGITVRQTSAPNGVVHGYAYTTSEQREPAAGTALSLATDHVLAYRISGGNAYFSIDGAAETSSAVGNIGSLTGTLRWGRGTVSFFNGTIYQCCLGTYSDLATGHYQAIIDYMVANPS